MCFCIRLTTGREEEEELKELHIGGVFPMEAGAGGWAGGSKTDTLLSTRFRRTSLFTCRRNGPRGHKQTTTSPTWLCAKAALVQ